MKTIVVAYQEKPAAKTFALDLVPKIKDLVRLKWVGNIRQEAEFTSHLENVDLVLTMGGDGTILGAGRICARYKVPVLGVNFGRVGFLTELEPEEVELRLPSYLDGDCWMDQRMMLHATLETERGSEEFVALNDVVVARGALPRLVRIKTWVDRTAISPTAGDGMIISTPTGSTAYSLAAGGPVLHPSVEAFMLTPIAPHLAAQRSVVLPGDAIVKLQVFTNYPAVFSADGQNEREMTDGNTLTVKKGSDVALFLRRRRPTHFYDLLIAKLRGH